MCLQWLKSSCFLFSLAVPGLSMMNHFSVLQRLHWPVTGVKAGALARIDQETLCSVPSSFRLQTRLESLVAVLSLLVLWDIFQLWWWNLSLKVVLARPV